MITTSSNNKRLVDSIANYLRESILSGKIPSGSVLSQKTLSEELNVSRTPIREALRTLENESLITIGKNRQIFVRSLDYGYLSELYRVREMIDGLGARLLAERSHTSNFSNVISELDQILEKMKDSIHIWNPEEWSQCNVKFHTTIILNSGNRPLITQLSLLRMSAEMFHPTVSNHPSRAKDGLEQHHLILSAIRHGEADLAENIARLHIRSAENFLSFLSSESAKSGPSEQNEAHGERNMIRDQFPTL